MNGEQEKVMAAVRELRTRLGLSQAQFATRIGKSYPSVQRYERGRPPVGRALTPLIELAEAAGHTDLASVFHIAMDHFLSAGISNENVEYQHSEFPKTIICDACKSMLSVAEDLTAKVIELGSVLKSEQVQLLPPPESPINQQQITPQEQECQQRLHALFESGDTEVIDAIDRNLRVFVRNARAAHGKTHKDATPSAERRPGGKVGQPVALANAVDRMESEPGAHEQKAQEFRGRVGKGTKRDTGTTGPRRKD
jgi:transcriptional regulator with XRE-family HTH domain